MLYSTSSEADKESHRLYHRMKLNASKIKVTAKMNIVYTSPSDSTRQVIMLSKEDAKKPTIEKLLELVDNQLHFNTTDHPVNPSEKIYIFLSGGYGVGVIRTEKIKKAYRILEIPPDALPVASGEESKLDTSISSTMTTNSVTSSSSSVVVCSKREETAILGISRLWVREDHKRQGIASILFDIARYEHLSESCERVIIE